MEGIDEKVVPFEPLRDEFLDHLRALNFSPRTTESYTINLRFFHDWMVLKNIPGMTMITKDTISNYQGYLYRYQKKDGAPLSPPTQMGRLIALTTFFRYLVERGYIPTDPTYGLKLPKITKRLPREVLSQSEVLKILNATDTATLLGVRDRAILEVFYSTGIRLSECIDLELSHVDLHQRTLMVVRGKNAKDRVLPLGKMAIFWVTRYLEDVRPLLQRRGGESVLFLTYRGRRFNKTGLNKMLRVYAVKAGVKKRASSHCYRHALATHMLQCKADIRYIQELLGHRQLSTTQLYTKVEPRDLRRVHAQCHPREKVRMPSYGVDLDKYWRKTERGIALFRRFKKGGPFGKRVNR